MTGLLAQDQLAANGRAMQEPVSHAHEEQLHETGGRGMDSPTSVHDSLSQKMGTSSASWGLIIVIDI